MVLGLLTIAAIPTTIAVAEGISSRNKEPDTPNDAELMRKFTLDCFCDASSRKRDEIHGGRIILKDGKVYISQKHDPTAAAAAVGFPFTGFYVQYPDPARTPPQLGLVSFISDNPPALNWIYIDQATRELKHGNRTQSIDHEIGPWGWEAGEEGGAGGLAFDGIEGAVAVEAKQGWELRWEDRDGKVGDVEGRRVLRVSLERRFVEEEGSKVEDSVEKKAAGKTDGKFEVTSTTVQRDKAGNRPPTKTETKLELTRSSKTTEEGK